VATHYYYHHYVLLLVFARLLLIEEHRFELTLCVSGGSSISSSPLTRRWRQFVSQSYSSQQVDLLRWPHDRIVIWHTQSQSPYAAFTRCYYARVIQLPRMRAQTFHGSRIMVVATPFTVRCVELSITYMKHVRAHPRNFTRSSLLVSCLRRFRDYTALHSHEKISLIQNINRKGY
jgi:hypothetical protein